MRAVVLDTNILFQSKDARGAALLRLFLACNEAGATIRVPLVVLDELERQAEDELAKAIGKLRPILGRPVLTPFEATKERQAYLGRLRARLTEELGGSILPYPTTPHRQFVSRAQKGRRPFREGSDRGYKDALIWQSVLDLLAEGDVNQAWFVSANTNDFGDGKPAKLHEDLARDVAATASDATVVLCTSISDCIDSMCPDATAVTEAYLSERPNLEGTVRALPFAHYLNQFLAQHRSERVYPPYGDEEVGFALRQLQLSEEGLIVGGTLTFDPRWLGEKGELVWDNKWEARIDIVLREPFAVDRIDIEETTVE